MQFITQNLNYFLFPATFIVGFIVAVLIANTAQISAGLKSFFAFIGKANSEGDGNPSSMRVNVFFALSQWSMAITFGFVIVVLFYGSLILAYLGILAGLVAGLLGIKVWQKGKEEPSDTPIKTDPPEEVKP